MVNFIMYLYSVLIPSMNPCSYKYKYSVLNSYNRENIFNELVNMRARIFQAKSLNPWDAKIGPGRLQDIDLLSQAGCLVNRSVSRSTAAGQPVTIRGEPVDGMWCICSLASWIAPRRH